MASVDYEKAYGLQTTVTGTVVCNAKNRNIMLQKIAELETTTTRMNLMLKESRGELGGEHDDNCPICLEPINNGLVILKCNHRFCPSCFAQHSRVANNCPMCRDEFSTKPKTVVPMPRHVRESIINSLFEHAPHGEIAYFNRLVTSIKMKSFEDAVKSLQYVTKNNCTLSCKGVIAWYDAGLSTDARVPIWRAMPGTEAHQAQSRDRPITTVRTNQG
jgi:hypothetical protein